MKNSCEKCGGYSEQEVLISNNGFCKECVIELQHELEEFSHPQVLSENGDELFFDEKGNLIKVEPKKEIELVHGFIPTSFFEKSEIEKSEQEKIINLTHQVEILIGELESLTDVKEIPKIIKAGIIQQIQLSRKVLFENK